jgi:hypothetical protein
MAAALTAPGAPVAIWVGATTVHASLGARSFVCGPAVYLPPFPFISFCEFIPWCMPP